MTEVSSYRALHPRIASRESAVVGRDRELAQIAQAVNRSSRGETSVLLITGEFGAGKTRLLREAVSLAQSEGFAVLDACPGSLGRDIPYGLISQAFGAFLRNLEPPKLRKIVRDLPDLGRLFVDVIPSATVAAVDSVLERARFVTSVERLVRRCSEETPILIAIDDLQNADTPSLGLLQNITLQASDQRILFLYAVNGWEMEESADVRAFVSSLRRAGIATELKLGRLDREAVARQVEALLGGEVQDDVVTAVNDRARGVPLFVDVITRQMVESGHVLSTGNLWFTQGQADTTVPAEIAEPIQQRIGLLAEPERFILELVAVNDGVVAHVLIEAASEISGVDLNQSLGHLCACQILAEDNFGGRVTYRVVHPLIADVVNGSLPTMRKRRTHAFFVRAQEQVGCTDVRSRARHYLGAADEADQQKGAMALIQAGELALSSGQADEAIEYYQQAMGILKRGKPGDQYRLVLERLGESKYRAGQVESAVSLWRESLAEHERHGDTAAVGRVEHLLALAEWNTGHAEEANERLVAALGALSNRDECEPRVLVDLHLLRAFVLEYLGDEIGLMATADALSSAAKDQGDARTSAQRKIVASLLRIHRGEYSSVGQDAISALDTADEAQDPFVVYCAHQGLARLLLVHGDYKASRAHAEQAVRAAVAMGVAVLQVLPRNIVITADFLSGEWDGALLRSAENVAVAAKTGIGLRLALALVVRSMILSFRAEYEQATECFSAAKLAAGEDGRCNSYVAWALAEAAATLALEQGRNGDAPDLLQRLSAIVGKPGVAYAPLTLVLGTRLSLANGDKEGALAMARELVDLGRNSPYAAALGLRCEAMAMRDTWPREETVTQLLGAAKALDGLDMPFELAVTLLDVADLQTEEDPDGASEHAKRSLEIFERIGAKAYAKRARGLLRTLGVVVGSTRHQRERVGLFSPRETEIAILVSEGLSNGEIADRLSLSSRTVATHLVRIYERLGTSSRAALARYVVEANLVAPTRGLRMVK